MRRALSLLGLDRAEVSVLLVGNRGMRNLNARYRGQDKVTDVLSFPMGGGPDMPCEVLGDIVICVPRAVSQASDYGVTAGEEIRRLLVHGLLHLLGYDHEVGPYQKKKMMTRERELIDALQTMA